MAFRIATLEEVSRLLNCVAESAHLEFKSDIPLHKQRYSEQIAQRIETPRDAWWAGGSLGDYGRDKLLEEIAAFANGSGGTLLLGIDEEPGTAIARSISPLPRISDLRLRLLNHILSCIEPKLPQFEILAIDSCGGGRGVIAVNVEASRVGPHRVTTTLEIPIRRGDKCLPMTMAEVQEAILRNSRRFDEVQATLSGRLNNADGEFVKYLRSRVDIQISGGTIESNVDYWLKQKGLSACAFIVVACSHDDIGISRISDFDTLIPSKDCFLIEFAGDPRSEHARISWWPEEGQAQRFLGGVKQILSWQGGRIEFVALRHGVVQLTAYLVGEQQQLGQTPYDMAAFLACSLGMYDRLRAAAGRPAMPAEVAISVLTRGTVLAGLLKNMVNLDGRALPPVSRFPARTIADELSFSELINATAQDFLDSADFRNASPPQFAYSSAPR